METIPYDETRNYTKRVLASYFTYSWLYGTNPVPSVPLAARGKAGGPDGKDAKPSRAGRTPRRPPLMRARQFVIALQAGSIRCCADQPAQQLDERARPRAGSACRSPTAWRTRCRR